MLDDLFDLVIDGFHGVRGPVHRSVGGGEVGEKVSLLVKAAQSPVDFAVSAVGVPPASALLSSGCCSIRVIFRIGTFFQIRGVLGVEGS